MYHSIHDDVSSMKKDMLSLFAQFVWPKLDDPTTRIPSWPAAQLRDFVLQNEALRVAVLGGGATGDAEGGGGASSSGVAGGGEQAADGPGDEEEGEARGGHGKQLTPWNSLLVTNGQAKELLADELRALALNPTKQANTRVIEEAIAANQAAEQQALEALEVYRVLAGEDGALQMELDEAMEPDLGSSTGITGDMALEPEKQHEQEHQEQEESKSEGGEGGVSDETEERRREDQAWDASEEAQEAEQLVLSYEIDLANPSGGLERRGLEHGVEALAAKRQGRADRHTELIAAKTRVDAVQEYAAMQEKAIKRVAQIQSELVQNRSTTKRLHSEMSGLSESFPLVRQRLQQGLRRGAGLPEQERPAAAAGSAPAGQPRPKRRKTGASGSARGSARGQAVARATERGGGNAVLGLQQNQGELLEQLAAVNARDSESPLVL
jgi:hypothetical protein